MVELGRGTIEHTTFPSGLHVLEEDFFGFRHGSGSGSNYDTNESQDQDDAGDEAGDVDGDGGRDRGKGKGEGKGKGKGKGKAKGDGTWPGAALFRSRVTDEGRGRRMITLGVVLGMSMFISLVQLPHPFTIFVVIMPPSSLDLTLPI
jgi:hypothetical protein